jgi:hypothetical protein
MAFSFRLCRVGIDDPPVETVLVRMAQQYVDFHVAAYAAQDV